MSGGRNVNQVVRGVFEQERNGIIYCKDPGETYYWFTFNYFQNILQLMNKNNELCGEPTQLEIIYPVRIFASYRLYKYSNMLTSSRINPQHIRIISASGIFNGKRYVGGGWL